MAEALQGLRLDACDARARSQRRQSREVRHIRLAQRLGMAPGHPGDDAQMARRLPLRRAKGRPTAERAVPAGRARRLGRGRAEIGRAHVWTPVTNAPLVCRLLPEKKKILEQQPKDTNSSRTHNKPHRQGPQRRKRSNYKVTTMIRLQYHNGHYHYTRLLETKHAIRHSAPAPLT